MNGGVNETEHQDQAGIHDEGLHQYGMPNTSLLLTVAVLVNLVLFAIGFVPAGRLRLRNE